MGWSRLAYARGSSPALCAAHGRDEVKMIAIGTQDSYSWFVSTTNGLSDIVRACPAILVDRYVAITSFDSGPLTPSEDERAAGWWAEADVMYSPQLTLHDVVPRGEYDEWYVFTEPTRCRPEDVFVNYGGFTLEDPETVLDREGQSTDLVGRADLIFNGRQLLRRFWEQMGRIQPETYLAEGDLLLMATKNKGFFESVVSALR